MKKKFTVALVGRPNVGKSSLFNRIIRKRRAIIEDVEGVTRDRLYDEVEVFGKALCLIDTGGIDKKGGIPFSEEIFKQTVFAVNEADAIIFVVDGKSGPTLQDEEIARFLLKKDIPVFLAVNKLDNGDQEDEISEFFSLGFGDLFGVSAVHGRGIADLLEKLIELVPDEEVEPAEEMPRVAVVGRPNMGKSTLINYLLSEERCVVSPIPGTTRDAIDIEVGGVTFIDTAGLKKKKSEKETVEKFASIRTKDSVERSDICILMVDAKDGITSYEKGLLTDIEKSGKGCIIFVNKWDLMKGVRMEHVVSTLKGAHHFIGHLPIIVGSAKSGRNVEEIFPYIFEVMENFNKRVSTGELNSFLERAMQLNHPTMIKGKRLKIYYFTQYHSRPPSFALFINSKELFESSYERYIINQMRKAFHFTGVPIRFRLRAKQKKEKKK